MSTIQREQYHILINSLFDEQIGTTDFVRRAVELCAPLTWISIALEFHRQYADLGA